MTTPKENENMDENKIASIKADQEHDKVMINQYQEEIDSIELKIKYYEGKFDAANNILEILNTKTDDHA